MSITGGQTNTMRHNYLYWYLYCICRVSRSAVSDAVQVQLLWPVPDPSCRVPIAKQPLMCFFPQSKINFHNWVYILFWVFLFVFFFIFLIYFFIFKYIFKLHKTQTSTWCCFNQVGEVLSMEIQIQSKLAFTTKTTKGALWSHYLSCQQKKAFSLSSYSWWIPE